MYKFINRILMISFNDVLFCILGILAVTVPLVIVNLTRSVIPIVMVSLVMGLASMGLCCNEKFVERKLVFAVMGVGIGMILLFLNIHRAY